MRVPQQKKQKKQQLALAAVALLAGLSLTACQSGDDDAAAGSDASGSADSSASSPAADSSAPAGGDDGSGGTAGGSDDSGNGDDAGSDKGSGGGQINTGPCTTAHLTITATHGMGEGDVLVALKNTSDACSLKGFPGVDLKTSDGDTISAGRSEVSAPSVVLQGGDTTRFTLHTPRNDTGGSGVKITSMVVTPPNETHSKSVPISLSFPVTDGSHAEQGVMVDPVGSGKQ
ncbi:DUF4232 domain-containing protein [Streptomyces sp. SID5785]|uniref:DUF4232 domain-containing protein n=1 Tax=Streptomyces sp. SID5785 TaxID=2690309 RepID=UPI001361B815|nr:DUF4232 domain-containing protein [Streptomyces sp. SID5785]MZD04855.1 DUF4232 domain-containing protein [Streptomyces sp. SID5785]